jgi:ubiquinone/menaquinone biosynthesis C-methylase UbiE
MSENNILPESCTQDSGMSNTRTTFYENTISKWIEDKNSSVLVVGGGTTDRNVFYKLGFTNVIISNLDSRLRGDEFSPYQWSFQKAEDLNTKNDAFDFVVVHAALHHCESPHRALLEMYRTAKTSIIAFESRDSLLMNFLELIGLTPSYEYVAVHFNGGKFGGVNNSEIPNYIYRWKEREVEKTISTYAPYAKHKYYYEYGSDVPSSFNAESKAIFKKILVAFANPFYRMFVLLFPKQQNLFAFRVDKPDLNRDLQQWVKLENGEIKFNNEWADELYKQK